MFVTGSSSVRVSAEENVWNWQLKGKGWEKYL
jgi:hypothetical protein